MNIKHPLATLYDEKHTEACEVALVALLRAFGTLNRDLRLVGGLVPRYLTPANPPDVPIHTGTTDVDVVLNISVLAARGTYDKLMRQLKDNGFERYKVKEDGPASSWQWVYNADDIPIVVEFLQHTDDPLQSARLASIDGEDISACQILHAGIAHDCYKEKEIIVELPDNGGLVKETVRYADAVAFVVLKAISFNQRHEPKDAADLIHVMRYYKSIDDLASEFAEHMRSGPHTAGIEHALQALKDNFCDEPGIEGFKKDGPSLFANFHGLREVDPELRIQEQRDVSGLVTHFLDLVKRLLHANNRC